ncbi:MAG: hypothetical protein ACLVB5_06455 [Christensenellales bacterium]
MLMKMRMKRAIDNCIELFRTENASDGKRPEAACASAENFESAEVGAHGQTARNRKLKIHRRPLRLFSGTGRQFVLTKSAGQVIQTVHAQKGRR